MGNMSYCRFENTLADMRDCLYAIEAGLDVEELSDYEISALHDFTHVAKQIADYQGRVDNVIEKFKEING